MTTRRLYRFATLGAVVVLAPAIAIGSGLDKRLSEALPMFPVPNKQDLPAFSPMQLKIGLDALAAKDFDGARAARDNLSVSSLDHHILAWAIALYGGDRVPSGEIAAASELLPGWPGMATLRKNSERALARENPAADLVVKSFAGSRPQTAEGTIVLARAYVTKGDVKAAQAVLSPFWRTEKLEVKDETAIINEFGPIIPTADHRYRMERMFYANRVGSAQRVATLAGAKELADAWAAASQGDRNTPKLLAAVPTEQRGAGYLFAEAEYLRKRKKFADAAALLLKAPDDRAALVDPDAWWIERRALSRELIDKGDMKTAYRIVAAHMAESPTNAADAEFHAGWYALRGLKDPAKAAEHFSRIANLAQGSLSLSRAYYWLGRAAEAGGPGDAKEYFTKASTFGTTFYGQLAGERVGNRTLNIASPQPSDVDRLSFSKREAVSAIGRLQEAGYERYANTLYLDLAGQLTSPGEVALLADMAEKQGNHFLALRIGKIAAANGVNVGALSHPIGVIPETANISGSGKALAYAIARQESEFNVSAVSRVGALGLLQLMPSTAEQLAKKAGMAFSQTKLTTDPGYNATLGAAFLGQQLDRYNGSYVLTFAGYNAGPRRADQWMKRYGDPRGKDIDTIVDWIERLPYAETRSYIQRVMENYEVYKMRISGEFDIVGDLVNGRK